MVTINETEVFQQLDQTATKLFPGCGFKFSIRILHEARWRGWIQISMMKSHGDAAGFCFFVEGTGQTFRSAVEELLKSFVGLVAEKNKRVFSSLQNSAGNHQQEQERLDEVVEYRLT